MSYRFIERFSIAIFITFLSLQCFAATEDDAQSYIDYAISKQKSDPKAANSALEQAYYLATKQNNKQLIVKTLIEQAQTAKLNKDYFLAQQYLNKAEEIIPVLNDNELSVDMLTNMSAVQRYLNNYELSMEYVQRALIIGRESRQPALILKCLQTKGTLLREMRRYEESLATLLSAERYVTEALPANKVSLWKDIARAYNSVNQYDSAIKYYTQASDLLADSDKVKLMPSILIDLAKTQVRVARYVPSLENANRALEIGREYKNDKHIVKSLIVLSVIYRKVGSYENALSHAVEAIDIYERTDDFNGIAAASNSVGLVYTHLNQVENAKSYFTRVIELPTEEVNSKYRAAALRGLGRLTFAEGARDKGLSLSIEAHNIYEKIGDRHGAATVLKNIGHMYYKMSDLNESINSYNSAIKVFNSINDVWNEAESKVHLSLVLIDVEPKKAIQLALDSLEVSSEIGAKSVTEQAYTALILAEEKSHNYKQALAYYKKKEALTDEIKAEAINKKLAEIHIVAEVEKREREFQLLKNEKEVISLDLDNKKNRLILLEKEKTISELKNKNTIIMISVSSVILLLIVLLLRRKYF